MVGHKVKVSQNEISRKDIHAVSQYCNLQFNVLFEIYFQKLSPEIYRINNLKFDDSNDRAPFPLYP